MANMKHDELVQTNKRVVEVICSKLLRDGIIDDGAEVCEDHMKLCSMKILSELTNPQLEAFILARDTSIIKSQLPAKGKLKDAEDDTVRNRICLAFDCRTMPNKLRERFPLIYLIKQMQTQPRIIVSTRLHSPMIARFHRQHYSVIGLGLRMLLDCLISKRQLTQHRKYLRLRKRRRICF